MRQLHGEKAKRYIRKEHKHHDFWVSAAGQRAFVVYIVPKKKTKRITIGTLRHTSIVVMYDGKVIFPFNMLELWEKIYDPKVPCKICGKKIKRSGLYYDDECLQCYTIAMDAALDAERRDFWEGEPGQSVEMTDYLKDAMDSCGKEVEPYE